MRQFQGLGHGFSLIPLLIEGSLIIESLVIGEWVIVDLVDLLGIGGFGIGFRAGGRGRQAMHSGFEDGGLHSTIKNPPINNQSTIKDPQITNGLKIFG